MRIISSIDSDQGLWPIAERQWPQIVGSVRGIRDAFILILNNDVDAEEISIVFSSILLLKREHFDSNITDELHPEMQNNQYPVMIMEI